MEETIKILKAEFENFKVKKIQEILPDDNPLNEQSFIQKIKPISSLFTPSGIRDGIYKSKP